MKYYRIPALHLLISIWVLSSCRTSDTVLVVEQAPSTDVAGQREDEPGVQATFVEISIGLIDPVTNLDPLFAEDLSTKRVIGLLFDGLVTLDRNGETVLNLASDIE